MASATNYLETLITDLVTGKTTSISISGNRYLSLHTASPTDTGSTANEVDTSGTGYGRANITSAMADADATTGSSSNGTIIAFSAALTDWGTITHIGIHDAETGGNMLVWAALSTSREIAVSDIFQFSASQLLVQTA